MINKNNIKDLYGKAIFKLETDIDFDTFIDIFQDDMEWDSLKDLCNDIKEFLYDNIYETIKHNIKQTGLNDNIGYKIKINDKNYSQMEIGII